MTEQQTLYAAEDEDCIPDPTPDAKEADMCMARHGDSQACCTLRDCHPGVHMASDAEKIVVIWRDVR